MISLTVMGEGASQDITLYTGNYQLSDNIDTLGAEFKFRLMSNPLDKNFAGKEIELGSKVAFVHDGVMMFSGIVTSFSRNHMAIWEYTCYDYGFYLNKNEVMIQFNKVSVSDALKRLCQENGVAVGEICDISTVVSKIYSGNTIGDVLKDLLKMASDELKVSYRMEMRSNKLYIEKYQDLYVNTKVINLVGNFSNSNSIEDMKNRIVVVSSSEKNAQIIAETSDAESIKKYGQLTKVEKIEDKKKSQASSIAEGMLSNLKTVKKTFSVTTLGSDLVRAGRMLVFNQPEINLTGAFLVKTCTHTYDGNKHLMQLDLEV